MPMVVHPGINLKVKFALKVIMAIGLENKESSDISAYLEANESRIAEENST
jgi:hypothetical protein